MAMHNANRPFIEIDERLDEVQVFARQAGLGEHAHAAALLGGRAREVLYHHASTRADLNQRTVCTVSYFMMVIVAVCMQTCAPHENAFSILRINIRILQSFSVVFLVAPHIAEIGLKNKNKKINK